MTMRVLLWGGPLHGREIALQDGSGDFQILQPPPTFGNVLEDARKGTYTRIRHSGHPNEFEWVGWEKK